MRVTRRKHHNQMIFDYSLHNQTLENVQSAKNLGISISDNMDWGHHVSDYFPKQLGHLVSFGGRISSDKTGYFPK